MERLERIVASLPEAERVDIEKWGGHPSFRVRGKNFLFSNLEATSMSLKLSREEAAAVVATDPTAGPAGYGLGRHGWIDFTLEPDADAERWEIIEEWVLTSYALIAPTQLADQVLKDTGDSDSREQS
ncbi:MAG: MmcQ/YjbR family DNA-binding protein [Acidimicrobiia bacterium]|nr:MmcQ/YjbR family DNA-binding protein [Acidimicrobiia bacterium]